MSRFMLTACLLVGMSASSAVAQVTRVVDDDGQGTAANCDDSTATFAKVGAAITAAVAGDTVLVCPGTYVENINFGGKAIVVRSAEGAAVTILDGNSFHSVVTFASGETSASILEGFTIRNGHESFGGGGILIVSASPVIRRNVIVGNWACRGIGVHVERGSPLIEENTVANNFQTQCFGDLEGGGIAILGGSATIRRNLIYDNGGVRTGGGIGIKGAVSPTIENNVIRGNRATNGGGIGMINSSNPSIKGNLIIRNEAQSGGGLYWMTVYPGILLVNNTIVDNPSSVGSGLVAGGTDQNTRLWNNIIVAAEGQTAVLCVPGNDQYTPAFFSNDVFSATGASYGGTCTDQTGLNGNISADPLFTDPSSGDYHLLAGSPAIDAGDDSATELPSADIDGHGRVLDGNGDSAVAVDIGADEAPSRATTPGAFNKTGPPNAAQDQKRAVLLTWDASAGATAYEYCYDKVDNNACDGTWMPTWNATRATLFGLDGGTTYYWQVRGINGAGLTYANGSSSNFWTFTTEVPLLTRIIGLSGDLDFGTIRAGEEFPIRTLTITNSGTDPLTISSLTLPYRFSGDFSGTIAAGGSRAVQIFFNPLTPGTYSGTIRVNGNQTDGTSTISVIGIAYQPSRIMTITGDLDFGNVTVGTTATRTLTISNSGTDPLGVLNLTYPIGFSGLFGGSIAPGASQTVTVTFAPTTPITYAGTIHVIANETSGNDDVAVTGVGTPPAGMQVPWQNLVNGSLEVWYMQGSTVMAQLPLSIGQVGDRSWRVVGTGDLNGDGTPDFVWQHMVEGWVGVWLMNGNAVVSTQLLSIDRVDPHWTIRGVGDVDGDGRADLIWQHPTEGWVGVWFMKGSQVLSTSLLSIDRVTDTCWEVVGAGDATGDGTADIIWQDRCRGSLARWSLRAAEVTATEFLSYQITDPTWHIRGVGDCSGDGRADLLWQNDVSGALAVWELNGSAVTNSYYLSTTRPDTTWRVVGPG